MEKVEKIYKFGGSSVRDAAHLDKVVRIISAEDYRPLIVVVSAMGKTTNDLEQLLHSARSDAWDDAAWSRLCNVHREVCKELKLSQDVLDTLNQLLSEVKDQLQSADLSYDEHYDTVMGEGERLSSLLLAANLRNHGQSAALLDARNLIMTDDIHRNARVLWEESIPQIRSQIHNSLIDHDIVVTQGFTGRSVSGAPTTLGREGSDYTGAILAYALDADSLTVWKDVDGIYSSDPNRSSEAVKMDVIDYREATEMTYYGAKVIHPKTIKPLENKGIQLIVRSYVNSDKSGTIISSVGAKAYPPIIVREENQLLLKVKTRDLSFVAEGHLADVFRLCNEYRVKVNAMKNTAVSFLICFTDDGRRSQQCIEALRESFDVELIDDVELMTIRHSTPQLVESLLRHRVIYFKESYGSTVQVICNQTAK